MSTVIVNVADGVAVPSSVACACLVTAPKSEGAAALNVAVFVILLASTSACVTMYFAVYIKVSCGCKVPSEGVVAFCAAFSLTLVMLKRFEKESVISALLKVVVPVLVARTVMVTSSPKTKFPLIDLVTYASAVLFAALKDKSARNVPCRLKPVGGVAVASARLSMVPIFTSCWVAR